VPFPPELLTDDEQIVLDLRPHWWNIAPASAYLAGSLVLGLYVLAKVDDSGVGSALRFLVGIAVLVALGNFALRFARWMTTNFVVTDERIISRSGLVSKRGKEIPLDRINTVFFEQGVFERIIGAGDLGIESAGESGRETFTDVMHPNDVQQEIYRQKELFERRRTQHIGQTIAAGVGANQGNQPAPAPAPADIPGQIAALDQLRRSGAITEDEYQAKKSELLRRL
jgi:membrane protein YdbS with pleckstrin-like domain